VDRDGKIRLSHKEFEEEGRFPEATGPPPGQDRDREKGDPGRDRGRDGGRGGGRGRR
jgi:hypothetical protein